MLQSPVYGALPSPPQCEQPLTRPRLRWSLWAQWTGANALAEALGLGGTLLIGVALFVRMEPLVGPALTVLLAIVLGACVEGGIVGTAQWLVMRQALSELTWRRWAVATAIGAGIAWSLGLLPSVMFALVAPSGGAVDGASPLAQEPSGWALYAAAAALGLVAGAILAVAQWWVLRQHVPRAGWWLPANACAWAVGMALVFVGTGFIPASGLSLGSAFLLIAWVIAAGAAVGAIHGFALIWLLRERDRLQYVTSSTAAREKPLAGRPYRVR